MNKFPLYIFELFLFEDYLYFFFFKIGIKYIIGVQKQKRNWPWQWENCYPVDKARTLDTFTNFCRKWKEVVKMVQEVSLICQYICQIILHNFVQPSLASFTRCTLYEEASVFSTYIRYNEANIFMYYHLHRMHTSLIVGRAGLLQNKQTSCSHYALMKSWLKPFKHNNCC